MSEPPNAQERLAFFAIWAGDLVEELGGIQHGWSHETVRDAVRVIEEELRNIWPQEPPIEVVARMALYSVLDLLWARAGS